MTLFYQAGKVLIHGRPLVGSLGTFDGSIDTSVSGSGVRMYLVKDLLDVRRTGVEID